MARSDASRVQVQAEARRLRDRFGAEMSPQDLAALNHLETTAAMEVWTLTSFGPGSRG